MRPRSLLAAGTSAVAAAGLAYAAWFEPRRLVVRRTTLDLPRWPASLDGLTLGLLSDLHTGTPHVKTAAVRRAVRRLNAERPDLIAMLGDVIDPETAGAKAVAPEAVGRELAALRAPLGVFAVLGNHAWHIDGRGVLRALREAGLTVLENETVQTGELHVAGVADRRTRKPDLVATLRDVPADAAVLLLSHDPEVFRQAPPRIALTVSGHTHGGQIDLPLVRRRAIPSRFGDRYARGHVVERGRHLFVTSGIGTSRLPLRVRRPPEIVVLTLRAERPSR